VIRLKGEKGGLRKGEDRLPSLSCKHGRRGFHGLQVTVSLIHQDKKKAVIQQEAQNSGKEAYSDY
jgi:hypothetical protein